jgi:hypothetical protein
MHDNVPCEFPAGNDGTAILERLAQVLDPELDESILDLGFVSSLQLRSGHASACAYIILFGSGLAGLGGNHSA